MLPSRHFRLHTLGELALTLVVGETESPVEARPRHLAVLAVIALSRRACQRAELAGMFWGGETDDRARHSLSNALSALRAKLGPGAITSRRDHLALEAESRLEVDAIKFTAACDSRDDDRAAEAYRGPFLEAVYVPDAAEFDAWVARERGRLERLFLELCERRYPALLRAGRWTEASALAEQWLAATPASPRAFTGLLNALAAPATPAALSSALATYDRIARQLGDLGVRPDVIVTARVDELRNRLLALEREPARATIAEAPARAAIEPAASFADVKSPVRPHPARLRRPVILVVAASVVLAAMLWIARRPRAADAEMRRPVVAVAAITDVRGDSSVAWLRAGLPRLIANDLDAAGGLEVVAPSRVRDVTARIMGSAAAALNEAQAADIARRVGASWIVTGGLSTTNGGYLLDVTARSVGNASDAESFTVSAADPIELARDAASRVATIVSVTPGVAGADARYSGVGTTNAEAYRHFVRGVLATESEQLHDAAREFNQAITLDSGFVEALRARGEVAGYTGDTALARRLAAAAERHAGRLSEFERLSDEAVHADTLGETERANALAMQLVARYPHDPRAYAFRADLLATHGRWAAEASVLLRALALDSLAMMAGTGPCTPCQVYVRLVQARVAEGNRTGAEAAARRWVELQPDLSSAWRLLASTLAAVGRANEAVVAGYHVLALSAESPAQVDFARTMLVARRFDLVDSLLMVWRRSNDPVLVDGVRDLRAMLARERGQYSTSLAHILDPRQAGGMVFVDADGLARLGRLGEARAILETVGHPPGHARNGQYTAPEARGFAWAHAIEADALIRAGDTASARPMIDSLALVGAQSYYGRDQVLSHHARGMLLFARRDYAGAVKELRAAKWAAGAWTRTNVELARALLAAGHANDAIAALRDAYLAPLDGMGRYVPHSELDWWMSRAFAAAGQADSAATYAAYVRRAWVNADPSVRVLLDSLR